MAKLSIKDLDLKGQRVFIRVDFNVPLKNGVIGDDTRIKSSLPTIQYALGQGATVVLASHLGRPKGKVNPDMSLRPIADRLAQLLGKPVAFATDCIGEAGERGQGRRRPAREPALSSGGRKERRRVRKGAGVARHALRERRLRRGASRARVGRRDHALHRAAGGRAC